jgi:heme-degrading monooxygenase HmoA
MPYVVGRATVQDYAAWKRSWDQGAAARREAGVKSSQICRSPDAPNEVVVLTEFDTLEHARAYQQSAQLRDAVQRSGARDRIVYYPEE